MYANKYGEQIVSDLDTINRRKVKSMPLSQFNAEGEMRGSGMNVRPVGGRRKKKSMEGEGFLDFMESFGQGLVKGFTGAADVAGKVLPVVAPFIGLGKGQKGQKKYTKKSQKQLECSCMGGSGYGASTFRDTGFESTLGAKGKVGGIKNMKQITMKDLGVVPFIKPMVERAIGGKKRGRPSKKMQGEGILGDIGGLVDGLFGFGAPVKKSKKSKKMTLRDLEMMGKKVPDRIVDKAQLPGSLMVGSGIAGGRRTEERGDFSGMGFSGGMGKRLGEGSSGGKRPANKWIQLVNKVRKEQGFSGIAPAIKYIKQHNLYKK